MSKIVKDLISIIIPVYNTEKYLKPCLESIISQTYRNLDIILIDDGSTDTASEICDSYAEKDNRIRVFHLENGGVSNARNFGIRQAKGAWIVFLDSDDWMEPDLCEQLLNTALDHNADIVVCEYFENYKNTELSYIDGKYSIVERISNKKSCISHLLFTDRSDKTRIECCMCTPWGQLIKADLIRNNQLSFPLDVHYYEDKYFNAILYLYARNPVFLNKALVHFRQRSTSLSHSQQRNRLDDCRNYLESLANTEKLKQEGVLTKTNFEHLIVRCFLLSTAYVLPFHNNRFLASRKHLKNYLSNGIYRYGLNNMTYRKMRHFHYTYKMIVLTIAARYKCWSILTFILYIHSLIAKHTHKNHSTLISY